MHESLVCPERLNFLLVLGKRARGVNTFEQNEDVYIFMVCLNFTIFRATEDSYMFSRRKIKLNLPLIFKFKTVFTPPALNAWFFLLEHQCLNLL